jgi:hypothetical protein
MKPSSKLVEAPGVEARESECDLVVSRDVSCGEVLVDERTGGVEPHVLIIDEVGYLAHAPDAANVLFGVVDQRYLAAKPMVFTTNKKLRAWGDVLHNQDLAEVILDRVLVPR